MQGQFQKRAEEIYYSALEIESPEQRKIYLNHACRRSQKLRDIVDKMLASQPAAENFFEGMDAPQF
jgi:hypothetical protein